MYAKATGLHLDEAKTNRFDDFKVMQAMMTAIQRVVEDRIDNIKTPTGYSFEQVQRVTDELSTLVSAPISQAIIGNSAISLPADYRHVLLIYATVDGVSDYAKPIDHLALGTIYRNPFTAPKIGKYKFYQQTLDRLIILFGPTGTLSSVDMTYIKNPVDVSIGRENDKLTGGLTVGTDYIVYDVAEHNGVVYNMGDTFTAVATTLAYGTVLPLSVIVDCDLPELLHEEIALVCSSVLTAGISDFQKKQSVVQDIQKD